MPNFVFIVGLAIAIFLPSGWAQQPPSGSSSASGTIDHAGAVFVPNLGQWEGDFSHRVAFGSTTVFLQERGWTLTLIEAADSEFVPAEDRRLEPASTETRVGRGVAVQMRFVTATGSARAIPGARLEGVHHYILGNDPSRWRSDVPRYASVLLEGMYPGVSVNARGQDGHFEYDLILEPGADLAAVEIEVLGARGLRAGPDGSLVIDTDLGPIHQPRPQTWQVRADGSREFLDASYSLRGDGVFGFELPGWNRSLALVVDPGLLVSTRLGGSGSDSAQTLAVTGSGDFIVGGHTESTNIHTPGAFDTVLGGSKDGMIARLDPTGAKLIFATYIGGTSSVEEVVDVDVDSGGDITIAGHTSASNFPVTAGAYRTTFQGYQDAFVARLDGTGSILLRSTYLGGIGDEDPCGLKRFPGLAVVVAGVTKSANFTATFGAYDATFNGGKDGFIAALDDSLSSLLYSTYIGGSADDNFGAMDVDDFGVVTLAGSTNSTDFPTTVGAYATVPSSGGDAFMLRFDILGSSLLAATYFGGSSGESAFGLAVDPVGNVVIGGSTYSTDLPTTAGAFDATANGGGDAFVAGFDSSGALLFSTYLGGATQDGITSVAIDSHGRSIVGGVTLSSGFPVTPGAWDTTHSYPWDVFITCLDPTGSSLVYSSFIGGSSYDQINDLVLESGGTIAFVGSSTSSNYPVSPWAQNSTAAANDAIVGRFDLGLTGFPVMIANDVVTAGTLSHFAVSGPPGAFFGLVCDTIPYAIPVQPYGVLGVSYPPGPSAIVLDGTGLLGFGTATYIALGLQIPASGVYIGQLGPIPMYLAGTLFFTQAFVQDPSYALGWGLSADFTTTYGIPSCPTIIVP